MKSTVIFILSVSCKIVGELNESKFEVIIEPEPLGEERQAELIFGTGQVKDERLSMESSTFSSHNFTNTDYKKAPINILVMDYPPYSILNQRLTTGIEGTGETWLILEALKIFFNFSPVIRVAKSTVELIEKLKNKEADLTLIPLQITESRRVDIDFSIALGSSSFGFLVKRPQNTPKPDALLRPFNFEVWVYLLLSLALTGPLIYILARIRIRLCRGDPKLTRFFSLDECVWFVFGALMKQGSTLEPISDSSRILFATWWIFTVIVTAFYTANLTAFLTFNGLELPLTDVNGLSHHPEISWIAPQNQALMDFIQNEPSLNILREMQKEGRGEFMNNTAEALEKVRNGTHIYLEDMRVLQYLIYSDYHRMTKQKQNDTCHFYSTFLEPRNSTLPLRLQILWGFAFQKNSSLELDFNIFFQRMHHYGILDFHHSYYSGRQVCDLPKGFKDRPLENRDLLTTYLMSLLGIGLGAIVFFIEYCIGKIGKKKASLGQVIMRTNPDLFRGGQDSFWASTTSMLQKEQSNYPYAGYTSDSTTIPRNRPRTPFAIRCPEYAHDNDYRVYPSLFTNPSFDPYSLRNLRNQFNTSKSDQSESSSTSSRQQTFENIKLNRSENVSGFQQLNSNKFVSVKKIGNRTSRDLQTTEMALLEAPFTGEEISSEDKQSGAIVEGTTNGLHVLWDQRTNKLIVKNKKKLEESIVYQDGVPCIYVECFINGEPQRQKLVLTDYARL